MNQNATSSSSCNNSDGTSTSKENNISTSSSKKNPAVRYVEGRRRIGTCAFADRVAQLSIEHYRTIIPESFRIEQPQTCIATIVAAIPVNKQQQEYESNIIINDFCTKVIDRTDPYDRASFTLNNQDDNNNNHVTDHLHSEDIIKQQQQTDTSICNTSESLSNLNLVVLAMGVGTKFLPESILDIERQQDGNSRTDGGQHNYGERIRDCHAEILCRRGFRRYISESILQQQEQQQRHRNDNNDPTTSTNSDENLIFIECSISNCDNDKSNSNNNECEHKKQQQQHNERCNYRMKDGITLHFYCSSSPCGNSIIKKFATLNKEKFNTKLNVDQWPNDTIHDYIPPHSIQLGQFSLLLKKDNSRNVSNMSTDNTVDQNNINRNINQDSNNNTIDRSKLSTKQSKWPMYQNNDWCPSGTISPYTTGMGSIHTCSDKLGRWNLLGLQGSLLSSLLLNNEPIHYQTITVGRKFNSHTCRRAICCRIGKQQQIVEETQQGDSPNTNSSIQSSPQQKEKKINNKKAKVEHNRTPSSTTSTSSYRLNHPVVMGTGVYMDETGIIDMSNPNRIEGQDVRFHNTESWVTWLKQEQQSTTNSEATVSNPNYEIECIDGSTGYIKDESDIKISKISTSELTNIFLQIHNNNNNNNIINNNEQKSSVIGGVDNQHSTDDICDQNNNKSACYTLFELRTLKRTVAQEYEKTKAVLLTKHPVYRSWCRREQQNHSTTKPLNKSIS